MGQKVNPTGLRLGIIRTWDSVWYEEKGIYAKFFLEDLAIPNVQRIVEACRKVVS